MMVTLKHTSRQLSLDDIGLCNRNKCKAHVMGHLRAVGGFMVQQNVHSNMDGICKCFTSTSAFTLAFMVFQILQCTITSFKNHQHFYLPPIFEKRQEVLFWGPSPSPPSKPTFCLISLLLLKLAF